jgi:hypothetical protein
MNMATSEKTKVYHEQFVRHDKMIAIPAGAAITKYAGADLGAFARLVVLGTHCQDERLLTIRLGWDVGTALNRARRTGMFLGNYAVASGFFDGDLSDQERYVALLMDAMVLEGTVTRVWNEDDQKWDYCRIKGARSKALKMRRKR